MIETLKIYEYAIVCDRCGEDSYCRSSDDGIRNLDDAKKVHRSEGWSLGKQDLCPKCSKKVQEES